MSSNNLLILLSGGGDVGRVLTVKAGLRRGRGPERAVRGVKGSTEVQIRVIVTALLGFPYPQERICNLKITVDHSPFAFGSEPAFKLARHRITLLICKSRCHVQVTADNELLARRARRKGRAEYEVQERRSSGGPWRSGCVRARAACVAAHAAAWPARIGRCRCARPPRRNASERGKRRTRCCARARRAPAGRCRGRGEGAGPGGVVSVRAPRRTPRSATLRTYLCFQKVRCTGYGIR